MYGYIYLTENLINGKCYIGLHKLGNQRGEYKGSGKILKQAMKKYGRDNFVTTIIEWCETEEQLKEREIYWIDKCDAINSPAFYNIQRGGQGHKQTEETRKKISENNARYWAGKSRSEETNKKISETLTGRSTGRKGEHHTEETKRKISESKKGQIPWNKGIPLSEETKKKIGNVSKGKIYVNDGIHNKLIMPDQLDEYLLNGYYKGRTQETIDKITKANTGKKRSPESVKNIIKGTLLAKQRKKEMNTWVSNLY